MAMFDFSQDGPSSDYQPPNWIDEYQPPPTPGGGYGGSIGTDPLPRDPGPAPTTGGGPGYTDPPIRDLNQPTPSIGSGIPWNPGASAPSSSPAGYRWDPTMANFVPDTGSSSSSSGLMDDNAILSQIAQWAGMPGADPSLRNDPNYWLGAIKSNGGLHAGNLQYWQDAAVGSTAFFRNPNRESGTTGVTSGPASSFQAAGTNPGGYTDPSSVLFFQQLMQRLNQANQPQDNSLMDQLKALAQARITSLGQAPYSAADEQALITKYRDPLTQARDAAYARNKETASAHGYAPSSGLLRRMDTQTNQGYERGIAQGANQMGVDAVALKNSNAAQQLQVLSSLIAADNQRFDRTAQQGDAAVNIAKMFPDFDQQRLDQLLRAGSDTGGSNALQSLIGLGNLNLNTYATDAANSAAWGKLIASLISGASGL
jgi:hypothetical protein